MSPLRTLKLLRTGAIALLAVASLVLAWKYHADNLVLAAWSDQHVKADDPPAQKAVKLMDAILRGTPPWGGSQAARDQYQAFRLEEGGRLPRMLGPLSLTPREILEIGGPCENKSRLLVSLLHLEDIEAHRTLLYNEVGEVQHTVTEIMLEDGESMFGDPLYGLYFPKPEGGYYSIAELQRDESIGRVGINAVLAENPPGMSPRLSYYLRAFSFLYPRITFAWKTDESLIRRIPYQILVALMGEERILKTPRPYFMERPILMLLMLALGLIALLLVTYLPGLLARPSPHRLA